MTVITAMVMTVCIGCSSSSTAQSSALSGSPSEIIEKIYDQMSMDDMPMMMDPIEIDEENIEYYLGTSDVLYEEGAVSEPMISSIAYSLAVIRMQDGADIEETKQTIEQSVNPAKWICVEAEKVSVVSRDDVILLIMSDTETVDTVVSIFEKL